MADNDKVYVVAHSHRSNFSNGGQSSNFMVLGVCKDLEGAKRIAWKMIKESISEYESDEDFEITYRPSDDMINRGIEALDMTVYMHITHCNNRIVRSVHVFESKMT